MRTKNNFGVYVLLSTLYAVVLILALTLTTNTVRASSSIVYPLEDSFVNSYYPDNNYNSYNQLRVGVEGDFMSEKVERSFLKFSVLELVNSSNLISARLFMHKIGGNSVTYIQIYNASNSWSEDSLNWNNMPDYNILVNESVVLNESSWYVFDITNFVRNTLPLREFSLLLKSNDESVWNKYAIFNSREIQDVSPYVEFTFNSEGPEIVNVSFTNVCDEGSIFSVNFSVLDHGFGVDSYKIFIDDKLVSESNNYTFTLDYESAGEHNLRIWVNNSLGDFDEKNYTFTVNDVDNVVINEFLVHPTYDWNSDSSVNNLDQWVEFYNPTEQDISLDGWFLQTSTFSGVLSGVIPSKGFVYLISMPESLDDDDVLVLKNDEGVLVDSVSYGDYDDGYTGNNAPTPPPSKSTGRISDGFDTDNDKVDFVIMQPTLGNSNINNASVKVTNLRIFYENGTILLKWNVEGEASHYNVYISDDPFAEVGSFDFSKPNATTSSLNFTDQTAGSVKHRFYVVRAVDSSGNEEENTMRVGKFSIELQEGWNLISTPLNLTYKTLGEESVFGDPLPTVPENGIERLYRYDAQSGSFESITHYENWGWYSTSSPNFNTIDAGVGYWAYAVEPCTLIFTGSLPETITLDLSDGWNLIGWYSLREDVLGEESVFGDPLPTVPENGIERLYRYDAQSGSFESITHYENWGWYSTSSPNFNTTNPGLGYWAYATQSKLTINN